MSIILRHSISKDDIKRIDDLVLSFPDDNVHVVDLPYRLASWAMDVEGDTALWETSDGKLLAFAIIQEPLYALDYGMHPDARSLHLEEQIIQWAEARGRAFARRIDEPAPLFVEVRDDQKERIALLEENGYRRDDWTTLRMDHDLTDDLPPWQPPDGFKIRSFGGAAEIDEYVELHRTAYSTSNMTAEWRQHIIERPEYVPDLDIVATGPDGKLAGFAICWLHPDRSLGHIRPIGVHPRFQGMGLGQALVMECLHRLKKAGAHDAYSDIYEESYIKLHAYEALGFHPIVRLYNYKRIFKP